MTSNASPCLVNSSSVYIHAKSSISSSVNGFITFLGLHGDNGLFDLALFSPGDAAGINNGLDGLDLSLGELRAGVATCFGAGLCFEDAFLCGEDGTGGLVEGELGSFSTMSSSLDFLFLLRLRFLLRPSLAKKFKLIGLCSYKFFQQTIQR